jgi:multicomponent Na+:H+ antiporter subunit E
MTVRIAALLFLATVWVALWGRATFGTVLSGIAVAFVLVTALSIGSSGPVQGRIRPIRLMRFVLYFAIKLVEANAVVAWEVLTPSTHRVNEGVVAVRLGHTSRLIVTIVANSITLTPGTMVVDIGSKPTTLYVHVLHLHSIDAVRRSIQHLAWLLVRAIGTDHALREIEATLSSQEKRAV